MRDREGRREREGKGRKMGREGAGGEGESIYTPGMVASLKRESIYTTGTVASLKPTLQEH